MGRSLPWPRPGTWGHSHAPPLMAMLLKAAERTPPPAVSHREGRASRQSPQPGTSPPLLGWGLPGWEEGGLFAPAPSPPQSRDLG